MSERVSEKTSEVSAVVQINEIRADFKLGMSGKYLVEDFQSLNVLSEDTICVCFVTL